MTKTLLGLTALFFFTQLSAQTNFALSFNGHSPTSGTDCGTVIPEAQRNYVQVPHSADLNLTGTFTIEFWVNVRKADGCTGSVYYTNDWFCPISKSNWQSSSDWAILINPGSSGNAKINLYMGGTTLSSNLFSLQTATWYHIAITRNNVGTVNFYVNGQNMGSGTNNNNATGSSDMYIARNTATTYTYDLAGSLDELRLWNVARTQQQIQANMFSALTNYSDLIAYYQFNSDGANTLTDATSNGHNGTLQQFVATSNATSNNSSSGWVYSTAPVANGYEGPGGVGGTNGQTNLSWWLKGDAGIVLNGTNVQTWQDQSGNANDVTQAVTAAQPAFESVNASLNNQATVNFDGINSYTAFAGLTNPFTNYHLFYAFRTGNNFNVGDGFTVFQSHNDWSPGYVHSQINSSTGAWQFAVNSAPSFAESSTAFTTNNNYAISLRSDANVQMRFFNGSAEGNTAAYSGNQYFGPGTLGAWNNAGTYERKADLQWGEIILFNKALNRAQENIIYNYLSSKYGISLNAGKYYNDLSSYHYNLIGIGNSNDGAHAVAKGGGLMLNNFGMLNDDGDYFIAAHNNLVGTTTVTGVSGVNYRYNRLWNITNTDAAGTTGGRIGIGFDLGVLGNVISPGPATGYYLLFSTDGTNFSTVPSLSSAIINSNTIQFVVDASSISNGFYSVGASTSGVLPLQLISFDAKAVNNKAVLSWETLDEVNVDHFDVEYGADGNNFTRTGILNAKNSTEKTRYNFTQEHPNEGINYFRLKIVDKNSGFKYSEIKTLNFSTKVSPSIFPSPFKEAFTVKTNGEEKLLSIDLYDVSGKKISFNKSGEDNLMTIKPIDAPPGIYVLKIITSKASYNQKIVKASK